MIDIFDMFAIFGATFAIKETSGPFGILSSFRNKLFTNNFLGPFFYDLFSCYFCLGFHCSVLLWIIKFALGLTTLFYLLIYSLGGAAFCLLASSLMKDE